MGDAVTYLLAGAAINLAKRPNQLRNAASVLIMILFQLAEATTSLINPCLSVIDIAGTPCLQKSESIRSARRAKYMVFQDDYNTDDWYH